MTNVFFPETANPTGNVMQDLGKNKRDSYQESCKVLARFLQESYKYLHDF